MVINNDQLNLIFGALSDTTRRNMLIRLSDGEMNIKTLAEPYNMSQPAISKHVRVLEKAGLIDKTVQGRESIVRINRNRVKQARDWMDDYMQFWDDQFDAIDQHIQSKEDKTDE